MRAGTRILLYGRAVVVGLPSWWGWPRCAAHVEGLGVDGRDTILHSPEHAGGQPHRLLSSSDVRLTARGERHGLNLGRGNLHVTGRDRHGDYARAPPLLRGHIADDDMESADGVDLHGEAPGEDLTIWHLDAPSAPRLGRQLSQ